MTRDEYRKQLIAKLMDYYDWEHKGIEEKIELLADLVRELIRKEEVE